MEDQHNMAGEMDRIFREKGDTWPKILEYNFKKYGNSRRAMRHKNYGIWKPYTWEDYYFNVKGLSLGLIAQGIESGDRVIIIGDNAPEYYYSDLAVHSVHGISIGLYAELTPEEIKFIAENSGARYAIVEDQEQVDKFLEIKEALPFLRKVIFWNYKGLAHYHDPLLNDYRTVIQQGESLEKDDPGIFERNIQTGKAEDICNIIYTSGTTGNEPKGAIHTYRSMMTGAYYNLRLDHWDENDNVVPYLPPAWMSEQLFGIGCHLLSGCCLNFAESPETLQRDVRETGPSIVIYGARLWENQANKVQERMLGADAFKKFVFRRLMPIGYNMAHSRIEKKAPGLFEKILYTLTGVSLFNPIKKSLGLLNARICYSTGPLLSEETFRFFHALNLPLKNLYVSTEGGVLTGAKNDDIRLDTVGPAHDGIDIKVIDGGELIYKHSGLFIGYYEDPDRTTEVLKDGWFYSGDRVVIEENDHVKIIDRIQDIVRLTNGDELTPQLIESRLRASPYIKDAWIIAGPDNDYTAAIIIINYNSVSLWAGQRGLSFSTFAELAQRPEVYDLIMKDIIKVNGELRPGLRIMKFANLHREFDPDEGELTRTMRLRRQILEERYSKLIRGIYRDESEMSIEDRIGSRDVGMEILKTNILIQSINEAAK